VVTADMATAATAAATVSTDGDGVHSKRPPPPASLPPPHMHSALMARLFAPPPLAKQHALAPVMAHFDAWHRFLAARDAAAAEMKSPVLATSLLCEAEGTCGSVP
jgi:hypothetical protein